jgi:hypothetical protein
LTHAPAKEQKKNISRLLFFLKKQDKILYL